MSAMMPPDMSALLGQPPLAQALQQQPLLDQGPQEQPQTDPLAAVQDALHAISGAMHALPDGQDTQDLAQALLTVSRVQTRLMKGAPGAAAQG